MTLSPVIFGAVLVVAMLFGGAIAWVVATARARETRARAETELQTRLSAEAARAEHEAERRSALDQELARVNEARNELDRKISAAEVQIRTAQERLEEQKEFITSSRKEFEDTFKALSAAALEGSTKQFLELAEQRWKTSREEAAADLEKRRQGIETMLAPLKETLKNLDAKTAEMEKERRGAYDGLKVHLTHLQNATTTLQERTTTLASALRGTQVRGRWGELALRNIAELAGMTEHCDFTEQTTTDEGKRPDMVVRLPEGRFIAVDSKVPLSGPTGTLKVQGLSVFLILCTIRLRSIHPGGPISRSNASIRAAATRASAAFSSGSPARNASSGWVSDMLRAPSRSCR